MEHERTFGQVTVRLDAWESGNNWWIVEMPHQCQEWVATQHPDPSEAAEQVEELANELRQAAEHLRAQAE